MLRGTKPRKLRVTPSSDFHVLTLAFGFNILGIICGGYKSIPPKVFKHSTLLVAFILRNKQDTSNRQSMK